MKKQFFAAIAVQTMLLFLLCGCAAETARETGSAKQRTGTVPEAEFRILESGWIVCGNLVLGRDTALGESYLRKMDLFEVEIFNSNGVTTSLLERFREPLKSAVKNAEKIPDGFPPGFEVDRNLYEKYLSMELGDSVDRLFEKLGIPYAGKPVFDLFNMRPVIEYYWKTDSGNWLIGAVVNDDYTIEKSLIKSIPSVWR